MELNQLSANQLALLKQFREAVKDCKHPIFLADPDTFLVRWLMVQDFNVAKAEKMLRKSMEWRRLYRIDTIQSEFKQPEVLSKYFAAGIAGQDKYLGPIWVLRSGRNDNIGLMHSIKKKDYLMNLMNVLETMISKVIENPAKYKRSPGAIVQTTIIVDAEGFTMNQATYKPAVDTFTQLIQLQEANYPELVRRVFVINAPKLFSIAFALIKPFLNERLKNKMSIFGHDEKQWKAALLEDISPDQLPVCYGGQLQDPDGNPYYTTKIGMGGEVPKSYYFSGKPDTKNKKQLSIPNATKKVFELQVDQLGDILKWDFHSEDGDIAFAIYRKQGSGFCAVVPHDRVDCDMLPEEGEIRCDETGVYVVEFDNSFSFLRSKKIWYSIMVKPAPQPQADQNGVVFVPRLISSN